MRVEDRGAEVAGYLASYILPFVVVPEPGWSDLVGYAIFLVVRGDDLPLLRHVADQPGALSAWLARLRREPRRELDRLRPCPRLARA
jgi:hypothetical protein